MGHSLGILLTTQYYVRSYSTSSLHCPIIGFPSHLSVCGVPASFPASTHAFADRIGDHTTRRLCWRALRYAYYATLSTDSHASSGR